MTKVLDRDATRERAQAEARELHERLTGEVAKLASDADWRAALDTMRRFHDYSFANTLLIVAQRPDATRVAGYKTWQALGRQVRKGEKSIRVLAPMGGPCRACGGDDHNAGATCGRCGGRGRWQTFRPVSVFDVAQTDGEPLPEVPAPVLLTGAGPVGMLAAVVRLIRAEGWTVEFADAPALDGANGRCWHARKLIEVRADMDTAAQVKTAVHEWAHARLHGDGVPAMFDRGRTEVEAESVAYIVCSWAGLDSASYTLPYVAGWSGGNVETVRETGARVQKCAADLIAILDSESAAPVLTDADLAGVAA